MCDSYINTDSESQGVCRWQVPTFYKDSAQLLMTHGAGSTQPPADLELSIYLPRGFSQQRPSLEAKLTLD